jgi:hypothetical protein
MDKWYEYLVNKANLDPNKRYYFDFGYGSFYCLPTEFSEYYQGHLKRHPGDTSFEINSDGNSTTSYVHE